MEIIPVIDLKGGQVVRAKVGERASYRPIETSLAKTSDPLDIVRGLLSLHPFRSLYIADLDAIEGRSNSDPLLAHIAGAFPNLGIWVDNGCSEADTAEEFLRGHPSVLLVLGSESQRDASLAEALRNHERIILSLDFRGDKFLGPQALLERPKLWPDRLISMTLARVGSGAGPDFARFEEISCRASGRKIYLAGGLRGRDDAIAAKARGAAGILVASALHDGKLTKADLREFAS
jgi:phosphoribosylformimino-5-aminoimidazole carboxamide ribotide isomerase